MLTRQTEKDAEIARLRSTLARETSQLHELQEQISHDTASSSNAVERVSLELKHATEQLRLVEEQKEQLQVELQDRSRQIAELREARAQDAEELARTQGLAAAKEEMDFLRRQLKDQVEQMGRLERANEKLVYNVDRVPALEKDTALLREANSLLEARLKAQCEENEKLFTATLEIEDLRREQAAWSKYMQEHGGFATPRDVFHELEVVTASREALREQMELMQTEQSDLRQRLSTAEAAAKNAGAELKAAKRRLDVESGSKQRLERQKSLAEHEIQYLRENLRSYDTEEAHVMTTAEGYDKHKTERIESLLKMVDEYKQELAKTGTVREEQLHPAPEDRKRSHEAAFEDSGSESKVAEDLRERLHAVSQELIKARETSLSAQAASAELSETNESLQREVTALKSALNAPRILQLKANPTSQYHAVRQTELDSLKSENSQLLARLEGSLTGPDALVPYESLQACRREKEALERTIREKDKRMERLKTVSC